MRGCLLLQLACLLAMPPAGADARAATDEPPPPIDVRKTLGAWASDESRLAELREAFSGETCPTRRTKRPLRHFPETAQCYSGLTWLTVPLPASATPPCSSDPLTPHGDRAPLAGAAPFPHVVIPDFFAPHVADRVESRFPSLPAPHLNPKPQIPNPNSEPWNLNPKTRF